MEKLKIVFISNHLYGGGSERVLITLANYFCDKYDVSIISFENKKTYPISKNIKLFNVGQGNNLLIQAKRIRKLLTTLKPNVVISFEYFVNLCTVIASHGLDSRIIVSERNDPAIVGSGMIKDRLRNYLYSKVFKLVCQTNDAKEYFPEYIKEKTVVIMNPLKNGLPLPYVGIRNKEIVTFCRLNKQKNLQLLIKSFGRFYEYFNDYKLTIYGDGPEKGDLIKLINLMNLNECIKLVPNTKDVHSLILKSSMFVSSSDYEGLSNSMLESLAIGLPTICTDCPCGGARMVIENNFNGLLVPTNDEVALFLAMKKIATNSEYANVLSQNASQIKQKLSINKIALQWERLFE